MAYRQTATDARRRQWERRRHRVAPVVVARDGTTCAECGVDTVDMGEHMRRTMRPDGRGAFVCDPLPWEVVRTIDHVLPMSKGGTDEAENLQVLCFMCNARKGSR